MTDKRKVELYHAMLGYFVELISDSYELYKLLLEIGFSEEEIRGELDWLCWWENEDVWEETKDE